MHGYLSIIHTAQLAVELLSFADKEWNFLAQATHLIAVITVSKQLNA